MTPEQEKYHKQMGLDLINKNNFQTQPESGEADSRIPSLPETESEALLDPQALLFSGHPELAKQWHEQLLAERAEEWKKTWLRDRTIIQRSNGGEGEYPIPTTGGGSYMPPKCKPSQAEVLNETKGHEKMADEVFQKAHQDVLAERANQSFAAAEKRLFEERVKEAEKWIKIWKGEAEVEPLDFNGNPVNPSTEPVTGESFNEKQKVFNRTMGKFDAIESKFIDSVTGGRHDLNDSITNTKHKVGDFPEVDRTDPGYVPGLSFHQTSSADELKQDIDGDPYAELRKAVELAKKGILVTEGKKDTNPKDAIGIKKVAFSTVPMEVIAEMGLGMMEGARKYGRHNYRDAGVRASVYLDGTLRHLLEWWEGTDTDPDSGLNHITKALTSLAVLRDCMIRNNWTDDRPPKLDDNWLKQLNEIAARIVEKYPNPVPAHTQLSKPD